MRFLHLVLILFLLAVLSASARLVEKQEAETALHAFLSERLGMSDGWSDRGAVAGELREIRRDGRLLGYWSDIQPRGHVILSPITEMPAIKAWSDSDDFEPGRSGYSELILDALSSSLDFLEDNYGDLNSLPAHVAPAGNRQSWENLLAGRPMAGNRNSVGPLLTSTWNQSYPYYLDCPPGDGGTCLVGCVATAAAQILNYWKYPEYGSGSHTYTWDGDDSCGGVPSSTQLTATFEDPYDWDNILDSYSGGNSQAERDAVAELNYEVAVAYEMNFGVCGSGAYVYTGETVFPGFFRYAETTDFINRNTHSASEWWDRLKTEFDALPPRPIAYRIHTHAIIADGYQDGSTQYYHMNYGWGGSANAWYALDNLYCPWDGCNYMVEAMLIGIEPENFFSVTEPVAGTTWVHGDALSLIEWWGSSSDNVRLLLFRGTDFVEDLSGWTANDGSELLSGEVLATWGTGSNYRVKVLDEDNHFGWSGEFSVFAPSEWADEGFDPLNHAGAGKAASWFDNDDDGLLDLFLSNSNEENCLFQNQGDGSFLDVSSSPLNLTGSSRQAAWADYDNDGDLDFYLTQTNGDTNHLFRNDGGSFTDVTPLLLLDSSYSLGAAWGDYDRDGLMDLFVANTFSADRLFHNEGNGIFTENTSYPLGDSGNARSVNWVDYDNDGDQDLYLVRGNMQNQLYVNDGNGNFSILSGGAHSDSGQGYGACWGDYDNDGDMDLFLAKDGANLLLRNDEGVFTDVSSSPLDDASHSKSGVWVDYDNDGFLDLYLCRRWESNRLFRGDGAGNFLEVTDAVIGDEGQGLGTAWADYDGDGRLDFYLVNEGGANRLFRNVSEHSNHWLQVDLLGEESSTMPLGARVRIVSNGVEQVRQLGADFSYLSQHSPTLSFGLGTSATVDTLQVFWPSGELTDSLGIDADQRILIAEAGILVAAGDEMPSALRLRGAYPNPFNPQTKIAFGLPEAGEVVLQVFDSAGRLQREFSPRFLAAGQHEIVWDGRNDRGQDLSSGVYLARVKSGTESDELRIVLLK